MSVPRKDIARLCIFTTQRSGSTWFIDLLNNNPEVKIFGEVFLDRPYQSGTRYARYQPAERFHEFRQSAHYMRPWSIFKYLNNITSEPGEHRVIGFKLMYDQLAGKPEILLKLILDNYKIIHLVRENHIDRMLSFTLREKINLAHTNKEIGLEKVYINPAGLLRNLRKKEMMLYTARFLLRVLPVKVYELSYSSLCESPESTMDSVAKFLSISSYSEIKSSLKKISKGFGLPRSKNP